MTVRSDLPRAPADAVTATAAAAAVHRLAAGLCRELASATGNLVLSPYSAAVALGMTLDGAAGRTRDEMLGVLGADSVDALDDGMNALAQHVESLAADGVELSSANQLFGQQGHPWAAGFLDRLAAAYGAGMRTVDFERATEAARASVNAWTAARTRNRIEEIVPPDVLTSRTRLVLVNALYLKARWAEPFVAHEVRPGPFHLADGSVVEVPMMREPLRHALHGRGDGWQAVRLPYAGMGLAMTLVVPDEGRAADVEAALGGGALAEMIGSVRRTPLDVSLPRWTFRTRLGLGDALAALGMPSLFDPQTVDLGAMTSPREDLCVDAVLQEVFVAVDEHGTEAAAATAVAVMELVAVRERLRLVVDRPFWFAIHDVEHGAPLFVGRVEDPRG